MTSKSSPFTRVLPALLVALLAFSPGFVAGEDFLSEEALFEEPLDNGSPVWDPIEPVNRAIFRFNDFVYIQVMKPVARTYEKVTTSHIRDGLRNFYRNFNYPVRLAGNLLQGRWSGARRETQRFAINTTVGLGGVLDLASTMEGFERIPPEEVGQALGSWGIGEGLYIVLPVLGPSNARDFVGLVADAAVHPMSEPFSLIDDWDWEYRTALWSLGFVQASPRLIDAYIDTKGGAIDPYVSLRNAFTQRRRAAIKE